jgi:hypothetical protein
LRARLSFHFVLTDLFYLLFPDNVIPPCATELSTLLACFATSGDLRTTAECSKAAKDLHMCMANRPKGGKPPKSSVSRERALEARPVWKRTLWDGSLTVLGLLVLDQLLAQQSQVNVGGPALLFVGYQKRHPRVARFETLLQTSSGLLRHRRKFPFRIIVTINHHNSTTSLRLTAKEVIFDTRRIEDCSGVKPHTDMHLLDRL